MTPMAPDGVQFPWDLQVVQLPQGCSAVPRERQAASRAVLMHTGMQWSTSRSAMCG